MRRYPIGSRGRILLVAGLASAVTVALTRRWMHHWGVNDDELVRPLAGDEIVEKPRWEMTLATTIDAPPDRVWPWLAQMGYQRGGLYSYDWLDRLFGILDRPSADRILPQFQGLRTGDIIPLGSGPNWPVALAEPNRTLVIAPSAPGFTVSWAFVLEPVGDGATRLLSQQPCRFRDDTGDRALPIVTRPDRVRHDTKNAAGNQATVRAALRCWNYDDFQMSERFRRGG